MTDAYIVDAVRSPIGKKNGTISKVRGDELAAQVLNGLVVRHNLDPAEVEDVQLGCVTQVGEQGWNLGRMVPLVAGWPESVCGTTVDRQCGSSMQTNFNAATAIWSGQLDVVVSAGVEMMSRVPMGSNGGDLSDRLLERWEIVPQGISAEVIAEEWGFSREQLDAFSLESHRRAIAASDEGRRPRRTVGGHRPERRRHLARPSARRDGCADDRNASQRARTPGCPVRDRDHVHRLRPGDRRRHRAGVARVRPSGVTLRPVGELAGRAVAREPKEIVARGYDAIALRYAEWAGRIDSPTLDFVRDLDTRLAEGSDVLELGCGRGVPVARELARRHRV